MPANFFEYSLEFAQKMDRADPLGKFKENFFIPEINGKPTVYFCGNSLGLQPKTVQTYIQEELDSWASRGVEGHFVGGNPWLYARKKSKHALAKLLGANESEVVAMNSLSSNLHLLLVSFYRPSKTKFKILTEAGAFPSDQYVLESQARFHGFNPEEAILEISPRENEHTLRTQDILEQLTLHQSEIALVMLSGIQYYTGQLFDIKAISSAAHQFDIPVGFDLAHAIGNVPLELHDWNVDFATWCSYKYLNAGPGNVSGIFVHEKHGNSSQIPRFAGWWGHDEGERFLMKKGFKPMSGADGWLLSNDNVLGLAALQASLDIFNKTSVLELRKKSELLTGYLEFLIYQISNTTHLLEIITPSESNKRGCQLSLLIHKGGKEIFDSMASAGVVADWRNPNVIRLAPVPLYNSFEDVYNFAKVFETSVRKSAL
ncbi:MAG TPA: kynureninase [Lunatimonas sp.]|nr:kynureninase [Lunatimonas sp.]